jgi:hypothetical protein
MSEFVLDFDSSETGAPVLNNAAGSMIGVLDACLVTGFNNRSITSLVVAAGVATATCNGHGFSAAYSKDVELAGSTVTGAAPGALNGRKQLTFVDTNTFEFPAPGVADQAATGTVTAKRAALGWTKLYSGTGIAIYKRNDLTATTVMLRVVDTNAAPASATSARWTAIETATDINTFSGLSPTLADGYFANKGVNSVGGKQWTLIGDSKFFSLWAQSGNTGMPTLGGGVAQMCFGDISSFKQGDAYNTIVVGANNETVGTAASTMLALNVGALGTASGLSTSSISRGYSQLGAAKTINVGGFHLGTQSGYLSGLPVYPGEVDGSGLLYPKVLVLETGADLNTVAVRGLLPGYCQIGARYPFPHRTIIDSTAALPGRKIIFMGTANGGLVGIDLTGPWG